MTVTDPWGQPLSCAAEVAPTYGEAMRRFHDRRSGDSTALKQVIEADPGFAVARATAALFGALMGQDFDVVAEIKAAGDGRAGHDWERSFVVAATRLAEDGIWRAQPLWTAHHDAHPGDLMGLAVTAFTLLFSTDPADAAEAEDRVRRSMEHVGEDPMLLGFLAMTAQDRGALDEAHRLASRSLELDPTGFSGGHPQAHVYFETGEHQRGLDWLDEWLTKADQEAVFLGHLVWHSALHHLAVGDAEGALERYPRCGGADMGGRLIDGPSLLWRCQLLGYVPSGVDPARPRVSDLAVGLMDGVPFTFIGVHVALALATAGDADGLRRFAQNAGSFEAPGAAEVLPGLAHALAAFVEGDHARAADNLLRLEGRLWDVGGSHAQREVFEDTLIHALIRAGRLGEAATRLRARLDRRDSRLDTGLLARSGSRRDKLTS